MTGKTPAAFTTPETAFDYLRMAGAQADADIDVIDAALALGLVFLPGVDVGRYRQHVEKMAAQVAVDYGQRLADGAEDSAGLRADVLRHVIHTLNEYQGDAAHFDDVQNANLIRVIERRRGLPVALGILYIALAEKMGWDCKGLNFPGHFVLRLDKDGDRLILDPFAAGREMDAASLRQLLKSVAGAGAELSHNFYDPVPNREVLLRLENNLKKRLIDSADYAAALVAAEAIAAIAPAEYRIWIDIGVLRAKLGQVDAALAGIATYIDRAPTDREKQQGRTLLAQIRAELGG